MKVLIFFPKDRRVNLNPYCEVGAWTLGIKILFNNNYIYAKNKYTILSKTASRTE